MWTGKAHADVTAAAPGLAAEAARLAEVRHTAAQDLWRARLSLGDHVGVVAEIESFLTTHPLREDAVDRRVGYCLPVAGTD
jgi:hypothetical protein